MIAAIYARNLRAGAALPFVVVLLAVSCATVQIGRDFDPALFQQFTAGRTTEAEVLAAAGEPWLRQTNADGSANWIYLSSKAEARAIPLLVYTHMTVEQQTKSVTLTFRDGVLQQLTWPAVKGGR
jgi:hypothetical protein